MTAPSDHPDAEAVEQTARDARERYLRQVFDRTHDGIIVFDPRSDAILDANPRAQDMLGYSRDELLSRRVSDIHPQQLESFRAFVASALSAGEGYTEELTCLRKSGEEVPAEISVSTVSVGDALHMVAVIRDVTERKAVEEELRRSEEKYRDLFDSAFDMVFTLDREGTILDANRRTAELTGYARAEILGANVLRDLIVPEDRPVIREVLADVADGAERLYEVRWRAKDGRTLEFEGATTSRRDAAGELEWTRCTLRDIGERRRATEALMQALQRERVAAEQARAWEELKSEFLLSISHELRTPLTTVLGNAELLEGRDERLDPSERRQIVEGLVNGAHRLQGLLSDLLALERLDQGTLDLRRRRVDVGELVRRVADALEHDGYTVVVETESATAGVDVPKMERVVDHLICNAIRHTPSGTRVSVSCSQVGEAVEIRVSDEGPGIPHEIKDDVRKPFRKGSVRHPHAPGLGVGLAFVVKIVERHGGTTTITDRPGGGTTVVVRIPR